MRSWGEEEEFEEEEEAWDDVNGGILPIEAVRKARMEEINFMNERRGVE